MQRKIVARKEKREKIYIYIYRTLAVLKETVYIYIYTYIKKKG